MDWTAMLLYIAVSAVTPGPNNLMSLYLGAHYGLVGARKFIVGSMGAVFVKLLLCGALNLMLAAVIPALVPYLKWLGALYMLYLAFVMLRSGFHAQEEEKENGGESTYLSGILLQCLNIKSWVFALSVFSTFVVPYTTSLHVMLAVVLVSLALLIASTLLWTVCGSVLRRVYNEHRKVFSALCAASLVYCAITALR